MSQLTEEHEWEQVNASHYIDSEIETDSDQSRSREMILIT